MTFGRILKKLSIGNKKSPSKKLILDTLRRQWRLLAANLGTTLLDALSEGAALGVVFMAVQVLASVGPFKWGTNPFVSKFPTLLIALDSLPRTGLFLGLLGLAVLLQAIQSTARYLTALTAGYLTARCRSIVLSQIQGQILKLDYPCASKYRVGDLTDLIGLGPDAIRVPIDAGSQILISLLLSGIYLTVLLALSPWLLLMALGLGLVIGLIQKLLLPRIRSRAYGVSTNQQQLAAVITEQIQGIRLLHSTGQLENAHLGIRSKIKKLEEGYRSQIRLVEMISPITSFLPVIAMALIGAASLLVFGDKSSGILPSLITFVLALQRLNIRISGIARNFTAIAENAGRIGRLDGFLDERGKSFVRQGGQTFKGLRKDICLEAVELHYGGKDAPAALDGLSLVIPKGATVALVGASGAGKSSVADLLTGLYEPSRGRVLIDGLDLRRIDLSSWQQRLGVVSQDTFLFNASIVDNISFGCSWATKADVEAAIDAAQAQNFISSLPNGLDTVLGERGYRLSGGQRQRLSLARAILRKPDLLILDEATSALDSQSELLVQEALDQLDHSITKLVIAHRLGTIKAADMIVVMDKGKIRAVGTHEEMIQDASSVYQKLWQAQTLS
jgi:ATP-binding cassette subfamily B protein/subfamily B ATP-binding cassette protein MsbA